jgi:Domain of unknown function (DUF4286)
MLLYNETIGIDKDIEQQWLQWMNENYIPAMINTGMFSEAKIYRILHENEDGTISYSIQFFSPTITHIQKYLDEFAPAIAAEHHQKFANKHVVFRTLLEQL